MKSYCWEAVPKWISFQDAGKNKEGVPEIKRPLIVSILILTITNMNFKTIQLKERLQHFNGSLVLYQIPLIKTKFTEGIRYLAQAGNCFWLVTDTSVVAKSLVDKSRFISIDFRKFTEEEKSTMGYEAKIDYSDGNGHIYETHKYHLNNFPLDEIRLFFVEDTLMLPSEY
tara:strand:+ start:551 stop:1060 length:510 start_codon:yes stop_codon:yes gene_type:complete